MTINKDIRLQIVHLRIEQHKGWKEIAVQICKDLRIKFTTKQFERIKKAGYREIKRQQVEDGLFALEQILDRR